MWRQPQNLPHSPPRKPAFGQSLEELQTRDGHLVPIIVQKCLAALNTFGSGMVAIHIPSSLDAQSLSVINDLKVHFNDSKDVSIYEVFLKLICSVP